ncbi:MAG TPA: serine--tRNA ligase [Gaiellaceae bacterium]|nr:serine--tRNA ligase [Gaiellaceae bacterium]
MIDLKLARANADLFREALARKGAADAFDQLLAADRTWADATTRREEVRAEQKRLGKPSSDEEIERARSLKVELQSLDEQLARADEERRRVWDAVPNPPHPSAPDGDTDEDAEVVRTWGDVPETGEKARDHLELAADDIDLERAARVSGSRFVYRKGDAALLELSLYRFALDRLVSKGFVPVLPPVLVREEAMYGTGFFPALREDVYEVPEDGLFLTGTSEVALAAMHRDEELEDLPLRYAGFSTCFRREAGAAGRDTRGMFRVHQFDKVEMFVFCRPEDSEEEHERLLAQEEEILQELGIPYRVVNIAAGDLGPSAAKKYDLDGWFPAQAKFRELTSTSNTTDFQARRLNIRFRREKALEHVHTLNGTAVTARALIAIMENFQEPDGTVPTPEVLWEFGAPRRLGADRAST